MLGFVVRTLGCLLLAVATAFAIGDIARSLSAEALRLTSVAEAAGYFFGGGAFAGPAEGAPPGSQVLWAAVSPWPVSPTLAALALAILILGRPRRPAGSLN